MTVEEFAIKLARDLVQSAENERTRSGPDGYAETGPETEQSKTMDTMARMVCHAAGIKVPDVDYDKVYARY